METAPVVQYMMRKQRIWPGYLLKFNPEHSDMEPAHCEGLAQLYMSECEDILVQAYLNLSDDDILPGPAVELLPQLKCDFVQNCLHDLAVISAEVDRYEIRVNEKVLEHNRRLAELAKVASYRGNGFAHDNFGLPVPTSTLKSIQQGLILLKYGLVGPMKFGQLVLTHLLKIRECWRLERGIHLKFMGGYMIKKEEEMEVPLDLNLKKTYQRYLQIDQCIKLGSPYWELADTVGRLRCHITRDIALPLLDLYTWKMLTTEKILRNVQYQWSDSELSYMTPRKLFWKGFWDLFEMVVISISFVCGLFLGCWAGCFIIGYFLETTHWQELPCSCFLFG